MPTPILSVKNLKFQPDGSEILRGISLDFRPGETVGLIGPNGAGKTVFLNAISGFLETGVSGEIFFKNRNISRLPAHERARLGIGRVFQNFGIFREMTCLENMILALEMNEKSFTKNFKWTATARRIRDAAGAALAEVGLEKKSGDKASSLSGGQMRLLEIARTLALGSELFLLDEPTAGVSPKMKSDIESILKKLGALGKTMILIEHDMDFIGHLARRMVVFDEGKVFLDGRPDEIRKSEKLREIYFGNSAD